MKMLVKKMLIAASTILGLAVAIPMWRTETYEMKVTVEYINRMSNFIQTINENGKRISFYHDARGVHDNAECILTINGHGTKYVFDDEVISIREAE